MTAGMAWANWHQRGGGRVRIHDSIRVIGRPRLRLHREASIDLYANVTLNSYSPGYHAGMFAPVTLIADTPSARIEIGAGSRLNGCIIHAQDQVSIGERVLIAAQAMIFDSNGHPLVPISARLTQRDRPRPIEIGDDVWIGLGAIVLPGAVIGSGSVIGANAVVGGHVPPRSLVRSIAETTLIESLEL